MGFVILRQNAPWKLMPREQWINWNNFTGQVSLRENWWKPFLRVSNVSPQICTPNINV